MISTKVEILTLDELQAIRNEEFQKGVKRGRYDQQFDDLTKKVRILDLKLKLKQQATELCKTRHSNCCIKDVCPTKCEELGKELLWFPKIMDWIEEREIFNES